MFVDFVTHRRRILLIFSILVNINGIVSRTSNILKVKLDHGGILVGRHLTSHSGRHMRAFMGVPYAKPPLGDLRFKPPVPYGSWKGEKLAEKDSPICTQRDPFRRDYEIEGSEDCLYINIYTPEEPKMKGKLPVMVWFHGGGWQCGSGISDFYGPTFLMDHDIILVSANFRLGPLGFLSTETLDSPGNYGLKDQVEVLKWIQKNIAAFGGNPNDVTLFDESAGGASITYHMLSEKSKGLFHKAIAQSGTYFNPWAQPAHKGVPAERTRKIAKILKCEQKEWKALLECLRKKTAEEVVATFYDLFEWDTDPMIPFPPVVEPDHEGAFLTTLPRNIQKPHGQNIPLMIGATTDEGVLKTAALLNLPGLLDEFKAKFSKLLPIVLFYDHHSPDVQKLITKRIESFYFNNGHDYNLQNHQNFTDLITDGWFMGGIDEYIRLRMENLKTSKVDSANTYVYLFNHKGAASFSEIFKGGSEKFYGVCHAEELQYLFPIGSSLFKRASPTKRDLAVRTMLLEMWVNFAHTGNPNTSPTGLKSYSWKEATTYPVEYVTIGSKDENDPVLFRLDKSLFQERVDFWNHLKAHIPSNLYKKDEL